jgi:hypothetical protein
LEEEAMNVQKSSPVANEEKLAYIRKNVGFVTIFGCVVSTIALVLFMANADLRSQQVQLLLNATHVVCWCLFFCLWFWTKGEWRATSANGTPSESQKPTQ